MTSTRIGRDVSALDILKAGQFPVDMITTDDFKVRKYSDTAIVTGRSVYHYAGKKLWEVRHTQVWANTRGRWQLVPSNETARGKAEILKETFLKQGWREGHADDR